MSTDITVSVAGGGASVTVTGNAAAADVAVSGATAAVSVTQMGGDRGPKGDTGPANTLAIGTVTGGATAAATLTGAAPNQTLSLVLPKGDTGANVELQTTATHIQWRLVGGSTWTNLVALTAITGPQGSVGATGSNIELQTTSTHIQWRLVGGSTWTNLVALTAITGPQGSTGATGSVGPAGPANSLTVGTVTTGAAGSNAAATITGTAPNQTLSLTIPRGDAGAAGAAGATGATGAAGPANSLSVGTVTTGAAGSNASASITGTAPNQTLSLTIPRGNTGETGATGAAGPANSLSIGTVTTGAAGSSASATITGTAPSQTLSLTIPRGDAGTGGMSWASVPDAPGSTGTAGAMAYDPNNIYVCVASNTWKRAALSTWTVTDPLFANVSLLLHMNGSDGSTTFTDSSSTPQTVTASGGTISTAQSRFGGASGLFVKASGHQLTLPTSTAAFDFGTGDFTIEAWVRLNSLPSTTDSGSFWILGLGSSSFRYGTDFWISPSNIVFNVGDWVNPTAEGPHGMTTGQWYHVAAVRSGNTVRVFVGGSQVGSGTSTQATSGNFSLPVIGGDTSGGGNFDGYIDEFRVTKGVARYTANFTPPTAAFPDA